MTSSPKREAKRDMSQQTLSLSDALHDYLRRHSVREDAISAELREHTSSLPQSGMLSSPEQVQLLIVLAKLIDARKLIEVGTFTGYTTLRLALALPDSHFICCDTSEAWTAIATEYWQRAGVADRVTLHIRPALVTLDALLAAGGEGSMDFAYVDADKRNYTAYYERCLRLLRPGGLLC